MQDALTTNLPSIQSKNISLQAANNENLIIGNWVYWKGTMWKITKVTTNGRILIDTVDKLNRLEYPKTLIHDVAMVIG